MPFPPPPPPIHVTSASNGFSIPMPDLLSTAFAPGHTSATAMAEINAEMAEVGVGWGGITGWRVGGEGEMRQPLRRAAVTSALSIVKLPSRLTPPLADWPRRPTPPLADYRLQVVRPAVKLLLLCGGAITGRPLTSPSRAIVMGSIAVSARWWQSVCVCSHLCMCTWQLQVHGWSTVQLVSI